RFGNGSEIRSNEASNCRGPRSIFEGRERAFKPPQAGRLVFTMACGMDQSQSDVCLRCRFLSVSAGPVVAGHMPSFESAIKPRAHDRRSYYFLAALDAAWTHSVRSRIAWLLCGRPGKSLLRLLRRDEPPLA